MKHKKLIVILTATFLMSLTALTASPQDEAEPSAQQGIKSPQKVKWPPIVPQTVFVRILNRTPYDLNLIHQKVTKDGDAIKIYPRTAPISSKGHTELVFGMPSLAAVHKMNMKFSLWDTTIEPQTKLCYLTILANPNKNWNNHHLFKGKLNKIDLNGEIGESIKIDNYVDVFGSLGPAGGEYFLYITINKLPSKLIQKANSKQSNLQLQPAK